MRRADYIVIGLGLTGRSCIDFLLTQGQTVIAMDTREAPVTLDEIQKCYPTLKVFTGENTWPQVILNQAKTLIVSPGVPITHPAIVEAKQAGAEVIGDVELFARMNRVPVIAITGSNGKSTVTALVGEMARLSGKQVAVIGNIGVPVLSMYKKVDYDLIVMELSSFQLETTSSLNPIVATVLNITPDHMDRYESFQDYVTAKYRVFLGAKHIIVNQDDSLSDPKGSPNVKKYYFTLGEPTGSAFGLRREKEQIWLAQGEQLLLTQAELKISGMHNLMNALSALALGTAAGLPMTAMLTALREFKGLPHRCQWVMDRHQIRWINDSKGTNVGACEAAIKGLGEGASGKIVLILGGDGKGADFTCLREGILRYCRAIILKGKDADKIFEDLKDCVPAHRVVTMEEAVAQAVKCAYPGDLVLLSPACASLDQYQDYAHRGTVFMEAVNKI